MDLQKNLISGFVIFLIALPLSVGISVASGAPPAAGLLSAVVGGCLGAFLSGSHITINGAAAGLIVVVLDIIQQFSHGDLMTGFRLFLGISVFAGLLQILMAVVRLGVVGLAVPLQALHGMMTAIGLTIIIKQLYVLGGIRPVSHKTLLQLFELPTRIQEENIEILLIGLACLLVLLAVQNLPKLRRVFPPALAAVILGGILSIWIDIEHEHFVSLFDHKYPVGPQYLLRVPERWQEAFISPLWPEFFDWKYVSAIITLSLIASIESQLSTNAVDRIDPLRRRSHLDRDLFAKGVCNVILGFIGGLPVISEIVRSTANVMSGATNRWSNFFHGVFVGLFAVLFPFLLNKIPLTTFAAILIFVGFRLANLGQFVHLFRNHRRDFVVLFLTVVVTLGTDLLIGVLTGCLLELGLWALKVNSFKRLFQVQIKGNILSDSRWQLESPCLFSNILGLRKKILNSQQETLELDLNGQACDATSRQILQDLVDEKRLQNKTFNVIGGDYLSGGTH